MSYACSRQDNVVAVETLDGMAEAEERLGNRNRLLPIQVALLAHKSTLHLLTLDPHNHVSRNPVRTLVRLALEDDLCSLRHTPIDVEVQLRLSLDDSVAFACRAEVLDRLASSAAAAEGGEGERWKEGEEEGEIGDMEEEGRERGGEGGRRRTGRSASELAGTCQDQAGVVRGGLLDHRRRGTLRYPSRSEHRYLQGKVSSTLLEQLRRRGVPSHCSQTALRPIENYGEGRGQHFFEGEDGKGKDAPSSSLPRTWPSSRPRSPPACSAPSSPPAAQTRTASGTSQTDRFRSLHRPPAASTHPRRIARTSCASPGR